MLKGLATSAAWLSLLVNIPMDVEAQSILKKIKGKVESTATKKILDQADKAVSKGMDKVIESTGNDRPRNEGERSEDPQKTNGAISWTGGSQVNAYSRYDFVPGDTVLYANDFSAEAIGELPLGWNSNRSSVVVSLGDIQGKWLRLAQNSVSLTDNEKLMGSDFTLEFDLVMNIDFKGWMPPSFQFGMLASGKNSPTSNKLLSDPKGDKSFYLEVSPLSDGGNLNLESHKGFVRYFHSAPSKSTSVKNWYGRSVHVAVHGQKERLRIWVDGEKLFDVPKGIPKDGDMNQLFFRLGSSPYQDEQIGVFISNIKVSKGNADSRHRFMNDGRFTTTGIHFQSGSSQIKPESAGVLKVIAEMLRENPDVRVNIVGHTDGVGEEASNLSLSKERAKSVKNWLIVEAGIDGKRVQTDGKGESAPVADNGSAVGRAQNRRVEFIKL
ncbi:OmpA/MotB domain protein [Sphingobacterium sp. PM2-P1-29]|nr:OmpA/MotB domain protein [Sphingobacterium sp. PM2-P1-29]